MNYKWIALGCNLLQIAALTVICVKTYLLIRRSKKFLPTILFLFGMTALMLSELYWLVHGLIRPDFRFPYSSSEVSQDGGLLLLAAVLVALLGKSKKRYVMATAGAIVFTLINIVLWIVWSGEWFKDIFDGLIFMYYLCIVTRSLCRTDAFRRAEWICLLIGGTLLMAGESFWSFAPESLHLTVDIVNFVFMFSILLFLYAKILLGLRSGRDPLRSLCLAYSGFTWSLLSMYMSSEPMYFASFCSSTAMMILMYIALERVVTQE